MSTSLCPSLAVTHSQTLTGLLPETPYHNQAKPRDEGGSGAQSADRTFTTPSEVPRSTLTSTGGTTGTQVVISGRGFGTAQSAGTVTFSGVRSSVVVVHPGVSFDRRGRGFVGVTVNKTRSDGLSFKINGKLVPPGKVRVKNLRLTLWHGRTFE